jgi:aspartyl-tRNA synthetase
VQAGCEIALKLNFPGTRDHRIAMLVSGEDSIREVIAFPKNNKGADLMAQSPCEIGMKELREVYVQSTYKKKTEEPKAVE